MDVSRATFVVSETYMTRAYRLFRLRRSIKMLKERVEPVQADIYLQGLVSTERNDIKEMPFSLYSLLKEIQTQKS